jgi:hypothetical protein
MRFRSLLVACALPLAATGAVYGCSGNPAPEDLCRWLQDPNGVNCIADFHDDIQAKCGAPSAAAVAGTFATRNTLDMCVLSGGGAITFDPPIEINLPPTGLPITMKLTNADGTGCGEIAYTSAFSWSFRVGELLLGTNGNAVSSSATTGAGGGASSDGPSYSRGTIAVTRLGGDTIQVDCPAKDIHTADQVVAPESHIFNLNQVLSSTPENGCPEYAQIIPQAIFEVDPGGVERAGALRLKIQYPPLEKQGSGAGGAGGATATTSTGGARPTVAPEVVYYFDCVIPGSKVVCENGIKDGSEVDVDCGGPETTPGCPVRCAGGQQCVDTTNSCDCDESTLCEVSSDGTKRCTYHMETPLPKKGVCSQIICANQVRDTSESDIDCGGLCALKCPEGKKCGKNEDCAGKSCTLGVCGPPTCLDQATNGIETDVDCGGGTCPTCADGKKCNAATDCASKGCLNGVCSQCADTVKDGAESDIDCGGGKCAACLEGKKCVVNSDCATNICNNGLCNSCKDTKQNGKETDIDCGGPVCDKCDDGKMCAVSTDCKINGCLNGLCSQCGDNKQNGTESDVDCGGGACPKCPSGKVCVTMNDCATGTCDNNRCGSCTDGLKGYSESDIDCGGGCPGCAEGKDCLKDADCEYKSCVLPPIPDGGVQAPGVCNTCGNTVQDGTETDLNCGGATCPKCVVNQKCVINLDCMSGICINKLCK